MVRIHAGRIFDGCDPGLRGAGHGDLRHAERPMYHIDGQAQLRRWSHGSPLDGTPAWSEQSIGTGWTGLTVFAGGTGTVYAIDSSGNLRWYLDQNYNGNGPASWNPASGSTIGTGWGGLTTVSGGQGVIYALDSSGNLRWYRYLGTNGSPTWATGSGTVIGTGWNAFTKIVAGGSGDIFAVTPSGALEWYRHLDPLGGTATWADNGVGQQIGSGWSPFTQIGSMGAGILLARDSTGLTRWYRDTDPQGGTPSWADSGTGISEGTGWNNSPVLADVMGCVSS